MIIFIPVNDLSDSAADAETIDELDFGEVFAESEGSVSFRLGNLSAQTVNYGFSVSHDSLNIFPLDRVVSPSNGELQADATSDTLTVRLEPPVTAGNRSYVLTLTVTSELGASSLDMSFTVVVDRDKRRSEWLDRATSQTDVFSDQIDRTAEWIKLIRYDPIAYDATDDRVIVERGERNLEGSEVRFRTLDNPCDRLDALNSQRGYLGTQAWIRGVVTPETDEITTTFTKTNTAMTYQSTSGLVIPAEFHSDLQRAWALFAPANGADREQYKRTVFLFQRGCEFWVLQDIIAPPLGDIMSYLECQCIQLHYADMGSPQFFNPFAFTYERDSDKPYTKHPCEVCFPLEDLADASGSAGSNLPAAEEPEEPTPLCVTTGTDPLCSPDLTTVCIPTCEPPVINIPPTTTQMVYRTLTATNQPAGNLNLKADTWGVSSCKVDYISITVASGDVTDFNIAFYESDSFAGEVRYAAERLHPPDEWSDDLEWIYFDTDGTNAIHLQIVENVGTGTYNIHVRGLEIHAPS